MQGAGIQLRLLKVYTRDQCGQGADSRGRGSNPMAASKSEGWEEKKMDGDSGSVAPPKVATCAGQAG